MTRNDWWKTQANKAAQKDMEERMEEVRATGGKVVADSSAHSEVEKVAAATLTPKQKRDAEESGLSAGEYIKQNYGVNPAEYKTDADLLGAISAARREE